MKPTKILNNHSNIIVSYDLLKNVFTVIKSNRSLYKTITLQTKKDPKMGQRFHIFLLSSTF